MKMIDPLRGIRGHLISNDEHTGKYSPISMEETENHLFITSQASLQCCNLFNKKDIAHEELALALTTVFFEYQQTSVWRVPYIQTNEFSILSIDIY